MLDPDLLPKVVLRGSRLLLSLIVRDGGRLVEARTRLTSTKHKARTSGSAYRFGGHHPGHPRPVASLPQRTGLLAFRLRTSAML